MKPRRPTASRPPLPTGHVTIRKLGQKPTAQPTVEVVSTTSASVWPTERIAKELARLDQQPPAPLARRTSTPSPAAVYIASLTSDTSRRTMTNALEQIARLISATATAETLPWWQLNLTHTGAVAAALKKKFQPRTTNRMLAALRGVLRAASHLRGSSGQPLMSAQDLHDALSFKGAPTSEYSEDAGRMLTRAEKEKLRAAATDPRDRALLEFAFGTGLRAFELVGVDLEHWDRAASEVEVVGKGRKPRQQPILLSQVQWLDAWLAIRGTAPGPLFQGYDAKDHGLHPVPAPGEEDQRRLSINGLGKIFATLRERAGVDPFTTHDLRRTLISEMWEAGVDPATIQKIARHANLQTTAGYDRRGQKAKHKGLKQWEKYQQRAEEDDDG
jgi:site-specific recombinase XerC